jgi:hypothetical protein
MGDDAEASVLLKVKDVSLPHTRPSLLPAF